MAQPGGIDRGRGADGDGDGADQQARAADRRHADTRFARMFTVSPVPLALIAEDGQVLDANPALAQLLNRTPERIVGRKMIDFTHPDDDEHTLDAVKQVADDELDTVEIDKRMRAAGRTALPVRVTLLLLE